MAHVEINKIVQSQVHFIRTRDVENSEGNLKNFQIIITNAFTEDCTEMNTSFLMISIIIWTSLSLVTTGSLALSRFYL